MPTPKSRLLFLANYLLENTDDDHSLTTEELTRLYEENGFPGSRGIIRDDIVELINADYDVLATRAGNGKAYHIGVRQFDLAELRMLVDAVSSSRFITTARSEALIEKLSQLTSKWNRNVLTAKIYASDRIKADNPTVFLATDTLCKAMDEKKKVSFHYWIYTPEKQKVLRHDGFLYVVSPYALIWDNDRYYLAAYTDYDHQIKIFRVDRMCDVKGLEDDAVVDNSFNPSDYARKTVQMFDGDLEEVEVTLLCKNKLMQNVVDKFGEEIETTVVDPEHFTAKVLVSPSYTFFSWVFTFDGGIKVSGPPAVKERYRAMLLKALDE